MKKIIYIIMIIVVSIFGLIGYSIYLKITNISNRKLSIDNIIISNDNTLNDNEEYETKIEYKDNNEVECSIDNENYKSINECTYNLKEGTYTIYIRNQWNTIQKDFTITKKYEGTFSTTLDNVDKYYLALKGNKKLEYTFDYPEGYKINKKYIIDNKDVIDVENDVIKGLKVGEANLTIKLNDGNNKTYKIVVTDLIQPATYNNNKSYLPCNRYSEEEAHLLDEILESRINEAGYGTRGAVVAAARFLTLEFPYMIRYFNENGRLNGHGRPKIDGEGRYYHKGLYLSEDKYQYISKSTPTGPKIWGCELYDEFIAKMNANGFTCSGFVTWVYKNAGFDTGDVGAGDYPQFDDDLSDMGPHHEITPEYMKNGNYKAGDFIGRNGHAALIIGVDENNVYTAESLPPKLKAYTYERYNGIVQDDNLTYVIEMSSIYPNGDGWYTDMW